MINDVQPIFEPRPSSAQHLARVTQPRLSPRTSSRLASQSRFVLFSRTQTSLPQQITAHHSCLEPIHARSRRRSPLTFPERRSAAGHTRCASPRLTGPITPRPAQGQGRRCHAVFDEIVCCGLLGGGRTHVALKRLRGPKLAARLWFWRFFSFSSLGDRCCSVLPVCSSSLASLPGDFVDRFYE
jgi:hypothetical protein